MGVSYICSEYVRVNKKQVKFGMFTYKTVTCGNPTAASSTCSLAIQTNVVNELPCLVKNIFSLFIIKVVRLKSN